ncbi:beta strand repeat-containing protein [Aquimarina agarivorans]|uniref:beta strand repeat-containing protein n=1 Tax=Aquimarina agarivorans TaxID=980584 RepID=UPI0002F931AB|nr:Calx-beta domain-containing protein [Aquimarina agarivorans]
MDGFGTGFEPGEFVIIDNLQIQTNLPTPNTVSVTDLTINEGDNTANVAITYTGANINSFSVNYTTTDGTALESSDYLLTNGVLNFNGTPNQIINLTIPIIDNNFEENDETFTISLFNSTNNSIILRNGTVTITDDGDNAVPVNTPLTLFEKFNGLFDYAVTGDSFRNDINDECSIVATRPPVALTSTIPNTATIRKALLFWGHSGVSADDVVTFEGQSVTADIINSSFFGTNTFFGMVADVTNQVTSLADPANNLYDLENLNIDNSTNFCNSTIVFGGWSLMIFYTDDSLPASTINLYNGFDGRQNDTESYLLDGFFAIGNTDAKTSVLSWEGDINLADGESLTITTGLAPTIEIPLVGDGNNNGVTINNPFNSTVYDNTDLTNITNRQTLGLDLDTYNISNFIAQGESSVTTNVNVGQDFVISNAVVLKVPSNLMVGNIFEDVNYSGGLGRNLINSNGNPLENVTVEIYREVTPGNFILDDSTQTDADGEFVLGGMVNGTYRLRVVTNTIRSSRNNGDTCTACVPVQTFKTGYNGTNITPNTNEIGGKNPALLTDAPAGTIENAISFSTVTILNEGVVDLNFGFNFNTIVNTNATGQGSLAQFITNSNELGENGLNIEAHPNDASINPAAGVDATVFMIPPTADPLGRTADANYDANGYFDIFIPNNISGVPFDLPPITGANTHIDGRSQTAFSGNSNIGTIGAGGTSVGTNGNVLPNYNLPEIQIHQNNGNVLTFQGANNVIRNLSVYANNNAGILVNDGSTLVQNNIIGVNALGVNSGNIRFGVHVRGGATTATINSNYIATTIRDGLLINGGTSTTIVNNHITSNGTSGSCFDNIRIQNGTGITIQNNLIEQGAAFGIDGDINSGNITITENTIRENGQNGGNCTATTIENAGIKLRGSNSSITNNIINNNGGPGIVLGGGNTSGNLISQNSIFANGRTEKALGIDLDATIGDVDGDGVTINDSGDSDSGPNGLINFPTFETATIRGNMLKITGWARPGSIIEIFLTDVQLGTAVAGDNQLTGFTDDYGEGQLFLTSVIEGGPLDTDATTSSYNDADGNTDITNRFNITVPLSSNIPVTGNIITATATIANSTSEFSRKKVLRPATVITNRRITYRVKPN